MVHHFLAAPFDDAARAAQFEAVRDTLQADAATDTLLLGNLVLEDGAASIHALVVRPHSLTLLVLVPGGGSLSVPELGYGRWQLAGTPLPVAEEFDNPFEQFAQQKKAVADWLRPRFRPEQVNLECVSGVVLFAAPIDSAPNVAAALSTAPAGFKLVDRPAALPRVLDQLATPEISLSPADLADWTAEWAAFAAAPATAGPDDEPAARPAPTPAGAAAQPSEAPGFLAQKARALWGWLGAADIPDDDPAYGADPTGAAARRDQKQHLEQLRQQMQADMAAQLSALEAREAERERSIAQLKAELAQAPPVAAEATALVSRLSAETREKAALEAEMQASRAESAARNQELDAKIQQLSQLIERLSTQPPTAAASVPVTPPKPVVPVRPAAPATASPIPDFSAPASSAPVPTWSAPASARRAFAALQASLRTLTGPWLGQLRARRLRVPKVPVLAGGVAVLALGAWGLSHLGGSPPVPHQENGRWGFADANGQLVIPAQFTAAEPFKEGRAVVAKDGAYGAVDEDGKEVIAPAYDAMNPYAGGYARVRVGDAYTFINEQGEEFDTYYFNARDFAESHAAVLDHRGWYYLSGPEAPVKPVIFKEAYSFSGGLARVKLSDGFTYITPDYLDEPEAGTKPFGRYQQASDFADGKARVMQGGRRFEIDKQGEEVK
ncbi:WG repeat-containing protein [Hymenobacter sp. M29]|uniref:WG repeat-containing protein n=1 Tax=Hymenobacter mellowenesis TaxID=3063995 RepID=A0ABT9AH06_9BACT|nr:WG repeat-containing protein [Hymenobacter sp. M29]MDO7848226.1 WG repeat-containing protein [Hymenobacter sp. M29]